MPCAPLATAYKIYCKWKGEREEMPCVPLATAYKIYCKWKGEREEMPCVPWQLHIKYIANGKENEKKCLAFH